MLHTFTQVSPELLERIEVCESEELIVIEYRNPSCVHSSYAVMQIQVNDWIVPTVISEEPHLDAVDNTLLAIERGRTIANRLKLNVTDAKKLMRLGSTVYMMIEEIVQDY